jgi:hypothetical protein
MDGLTYSTALTVYMDSIRDMQSGFLQKLLCRSVLGAEAAVAWTAIQPLSLPSPCIQIQEDKSTPHSLVSGTDPRWCSIHAKDPLHCIATKIICIYARPCLNFSASYLSLHRPICPRFVLVCPSPLQVFKSFGPPDLYLCSPSSLI